MPITKKATFVIAVYQDTITLKETLANLFATVNPSEIDVIVVDDANDIKDEELKGYGVKLLRNAQRLGVGLSLHKGILESQTEIVVPMGCDIRFTGNWFERFLSITKENPKSIISSVCAGLNEERRFLKGNENHMYAANILFRVTPEKNAGKAPLAFREYLEAKWNPKTPGEDIREVGCVLGAIYGTYRDWFLKIRGFESHRYWGNLEPLVSMRSYINGGNCLIDTKTVTGHIFKQASSNKPVYDLIYNKLLCAYTLLPTDLEKEVFDWVQKVQYGDGAMKVFEKNKGALDELRALKDSLGDSELSRLLKPTGVLG